MKKFIDNICPLIFLLLLAGKLFDFINIAWLYVFIPLFTWFMFYILAFAIVGLFISIYFVLHNKDENADKNLIEYIKELLEEKNNKEE